MSDWMNKRKEILKYLPDSTKTFKIAGLYGIENTNKNYEIHQNLIILKADDILNSVYLPYKKQELFSPSHYIINFSDDDGCRIANKDIKNKDDVKNSILIFSRVASIYYGAAIQNGSIFGFGVENLTGPIKLYDVGLSEHKSEIREEEKKNRIPFERVNAWGKQMFDKEFLNFYDKFLSRYLSEKRNFQIAINKLANALKTVNIENTILDLATTIEIFFNKNDYNSITKEVRYKIALLIGTTFDERQKIKDKIGKFYSWRSKIVHNGSINEIDETVVAEILKYLCEVTKIMIIKGTKLVEKELEEMLLYSYAKNITDRCYYEIGFNVLREYILTLKNFEAKDVKYKVNEEEEIELFLIKDKEETCYPNCFFTSDYVRKKYNIEFSTCSQNYYINDEEEIVFVIEIKKSDIKERKLYYE